MRNGRVRAWDELWPGEECSFDGLNQNWWQSCLFHYIVSHRKTEKRCASLCFSLPWLNVAVEVSAFIRPAVKICICCPRSPRQPGILLTPCLVWEMLIARWVAGILLPYFPGRLRAAGTSAVALKSFHLVILWSHGMLLMKKHFLLCRCCYPMFELKPKNMIYSFALRPQPSLISSHLWNLKMCMADRFCCVTTNFFVFPPAPSQICLHHISCLSAPPSASVESAQSEGSSLSGVNRCCVWRSWAHDLPWMWTKYSPIVEAPGISQNVNCAIMVMADTDRSLAWVEFGQSLNSEKIPPPESLSIAASQVFFCRIRSK